MEFRSRGTPASRPSGCWRSTPTSCLSDALSRELQSLRPDSRRAGYEASFDYCIDGRPLRGAAYPPVIVLYRRARGRYEQDGHTQRVRLDGDVRPLDGADLPRRSQVAEPLAGVAVALHGARSRQAQWTPSRVAGAGRSRAPMDRDRAAGDVRLLLFRARRDSRRRAGLFYALQRAASELILSLFLVASRRAMSELASRPNRARRAG